jgi:transposase
LQSIPFFLYALNCEILLYGWRYNREFKISVVAELEGGKPLVQIAREQGIHPSLPSRWRDELAEDPEKAFSGNGNKYKDQARIAELERLLGQAHAEIELLKKAFALTQRKVREEKLKPTLRDDT